MSRSYRKNLGLPAGIRQAGFSLIEFLVSIGIVFVILSVVVSNQNTYNDGAALSNLADELSLAITQTQAYGIAVRELSTGSADFTASYGIAMSLLGSGSDKAYIYFADRNGNKRYDGDWSCPTGGSSECLQKVDISRGNYLSTLCAVRSSGADNCDVRRVDISFTRPDIEANMVFFDSAGAVMNIPDAVGSRLALKSPKDEAQSVIAYNTGQVSVDAQYTYPTPPYAYPTPYAYEYQYQTPYAYQYQYQTPYAYQYQYQTPYAYEYQYQYQYEYQYQYPTPYAYEYQYQTPYAYQYQYQTPYAYQYQYQTPYAYEYQYQTPYVYQYQYEYQYPTPYAYQYQYEYQYPTPYAYQYQYQYQYPTPPICTTSTFNTSSGQHGRMSSAGSAVSTSAIEGNDLGMRGFMYFNTSSLPNNATISDADVTGYKVSGGTGQFYTVDSTFTSPLSGDEYGDPVTYVGNVGGSLNTWVSQDVPNASVSLTSYSGYSIRDDSGYYLWDTSPPPQLSVDYCY